ncbi:MAG: DNA polymerase III subunit chi [Alphaproteobacteria bacterium]|nr:DNA polymerase III subunit chi [Alphaproteobacteria bacterium]MBQ7285553.1 DNA polymerase III subunit chi [Alphaproteobacteria bacterium]
MSRVDFYHLQSQTLDNVLPKLLEKAYETKKSIVVRIGNEERVEFLNAHLWTYDEQSFLPHGSKKDGNAEMQPIWLTNGNDNPNMASFLFLVDGAVASAEEISNYERVFNIFDGNSADALTQARNFWKTLKSAGAECFYWQQDERGSWKQAA